MGKYDDGVLDDNMMAGSFAVFDKYLREEDMEATAVVLERAGIPVRRSTEVGRSWRENVIIGSPLQPRYWLELPPDDFSKARFVLRERAEDAWDDVALGDHPFANYDEAALREIVLQESKHGVEAAVVARKLLMQRGADVNLAEIQRTRDIRIKTSLQPKRKSVGVIIAVALVGVVAGLIVYPLVWLACVGTLWYFYRGTMRSPDGKLYHVYEARTREQGKYGVIATVVAAAIGFGMSFLLDVPLRDLGGYLG